MHGENKTSRQSNGVSAVTAAARESHINCTEHSKFGMCHTFTKIVIKFHDGEFSAVQRLSWLGHIERMQGTRMVKAIYSWKPLSRRPTGRPKTLWGDDVRKDI